jgi:hypothetical protein
MMAADGLGNTTERKLQKKKKNKKVRGDGENKCARMTNHDPR